MFKLSGAGDHSEMVSVRPYARLLTMLGEQLIKNDRIALVELIKNSYDADATRARVDFRKFHDKYSMTPDSFISLTDDGEGMSETVVRVHWLNPATPGKALRKKTDPLTMGGRVMQGEKGIGRFAIFKLGRRARIVTRAPASDVEFVIEYDLSFLDDEATSLSSSDDPHLLTGIEHSEAVPAPKFLDELQVSLSSRAPQVFNGGSADGLFSLHGTRIEIFGLRSKWTENTVRKAYSEVARLQPLVPERQGKSSPTRGSEFSVEFTKDGAELPYKGEFMQVLERLFQERAVLHIEGDFDAEAGSFDLMVNDVPSELRLSDPEVRGLRVYKKYFEDAKNSRSADELECGPFRFSFFVFDISGTAPIEYRLDADEKAEVKEHRIYLYRDGVRVLPYGDPDDDWLQLDIIRGTQGASQVLSNDQTVGFIHISQAKNPKLHDKTNREGLLEAGNALGDFVAVLQIVIAYIRRADFARYLAGERLKRDERQRSMHPVKSQFETLRNDSSVPPAVVTVLDKLEKAYKVEKAYLEQRAHRTEDLAGVGLSVEAASHDIVASATRSLHLARELSAELALLVDPQHSIHGEADTLIDLLSFVTSRLQDIQGLFVSTRKAKQLTSVVEYVQRVARIYASPLRSHGVSVSIESAPDELIVTSTDAALLQVLINFFDNAVYWLEAAKIQHPQILVTMDSDARRLVFADNGPGVSAADEPYIFEPFYSGKGEAGKGLGLYIARQVGIRNGFRVEYVDDPAKRLLPGANFVLDFHGGDAQ